MRAALLFVLGLAGTALADPRYVQTLRIGACCYGADPIFAASVAASPRGILVGIPGQTIGVAAVFELDGGTLRRVLDAPVASREFGRTVAAAAGRLAVGAPDVRAVYLFAADTLAPAGTIADPNPVSPPDARGFDEFGAALAIDGERAVVGAPFDDRDAADAGAAYLFAGEGMERRLERPAPFAGARFGAAVALAGDDVVVAAPAEGATGRAGAVYVFSARTGALRWSRAAPPAAGPLLFGFAVAAAGRWLVVGAPCRDGTPHAGVTIVYDRATGDELRTLTAPAPEQCDFFGGTVAVGGGNVVVGARLAGTPDTGAVHVFAAGTGRLRASFADGEPEAQLGSTVTTLGARIVVGAAGEEGDVRVYAPRGPR